MLPLPRRARTLHAVAALLALALAVPGCTPPSEPDPGSTVPEQPAATPQTTATPGGSKVALGEIDLALEPFADGFEQPLLVTHAGDGSGRVFVVEQTGRVHVVKPDGSVAGKAYLDLSALVSTGGERGLLGLAFSPRFADNGLLYVNYTDRDGNTRIVRYAALEPASDTPGFSEPEVLLTVEQPHANHNGGCIAFAPDGKLWVGMGDGGSAGDPKDRAQDASDLLGKMLALDVEGSGDPYEPRIVMSGLRNPWRFSFDAETDEVWIGDVGQNAWEEVDVVAFEDAQGANLGWNLWEGNHEYPEGTSRSRDGFVFPAFDYPRDVGQSVTGGHVYRGRSYPSLQGVYVYGDFVSGWIGVARGDGAGGYEDRIALKDAGVMPSSFGVDEAGELYVCDYNGRILRVTAR